MLDGSALVSPWRSPWGRADGGAGAQDDDAPPSVVERIEHVERRRALEVLEAFADSSRRLPWDDQATLLGALVIAAVQRLAEAARFAETLQSARWGALGRTTHALGSGWQMTSDRIATLARLVLRRAGIEPRAGGNFTFGRTFAEASSTPFGTSVAASVAALVEGMPAPDVLALLGSPDHIEQRFSTDDKRWDEAWSYDSSQSTTRLEWSSPPARSKEATQPRSLARIEVRPPEWTDDLRLLAALD